MAQSAFAFKCINTYVIFALMLGTTSLCSCKATPIANAYNIQPAQDNDQEDITWAKYMFNHMESRMPNGGVFNNDKEVAQTGSALPVIVDLDPSSKDDYSLKINKSFLSLKAKDSKTLMWLIYQTIEMLSQSNTDINSEDLPPSRLPAQESAEGNMAFEYRAIYSPMGINPDLTGPLGLDNINTDWAVWGHNFKTMVSHKKDEHIYALVNGKRDAEQFCFGSNTTFNTVSQWIQDNYGHELKQDAMVRFCIMPNDNDIVCQCPECRSLGNTEKNASPAVCSLVNKLCKRFPNFQFFTSHYRTTDYPTDIKLPGNSGIILSAIDFPLFPKPEGKRQTEEFISKIRESQNIAPRIYVWDYMCNFDNYMLPFPVVSVMQNRIQLYASQGVKGIILNGSGETHTLLDDIQTSTLATLLYDPSIDERTELLKIKEDYYRKFYPKTAHILLPWTISVETLVMSQNTPLEIYGGIDNMSLVGLDVKELHSTFKELERANKETEGEERKRVNRILVALSFTQLELERSGKMKLDPEERHQMLLNLSEGAEIPGMEAYNEVGDKVRDYANYLKNNSLVADEEPTNLLINKNLTSNAIPQEFWPRLTDGRYGLPMDWHEAWAITSEPKMIIQLPATNHVGGKLLISFLNKSKWRLGLPDSIELWQDGRLINETYENISPSGSERTIFQMNTSKLRPDLPTQLRITGENKKAIDEIEWRIAE